jgi:hypothetical protein
MAAMPVPSHPGLYAVAFAAQRSKRIVDGFDVDVRQGVEMVPATTDAEAMRIGKAFALFSLPKKDGWLNHSVMLRLANQVLKSQAEWGKS